jgi:hypothetical protein
VCATIPIVHRCSSLICVTLVVVALYACDSGVRAAADSGALEKPTEFRGIAITPTPSQEPPAATRTARPKSSECNCKPGDPLCTCL